MTMILAEVCEKCGQQAGFNWAQAIVLLGIVVALGILASKV